MTTQWGNELEPAAHVPDNEWIFKGAKKSLDSTLASQAMFSRLES